jgi:hypothetical protein
MTCIFSMSSSSSAVSSFSSMGTGSLFVSSDVTPIVVSSTNESHVLVLVLLLSTDTSVIHSNVSHNAVSINWFKSAHRMGELHLPWPIP